ncbi:hypothetical protein DFH07DRAFT_734229 [Mycena maculata]|uniref:Uncharacterized protein n=1 Tax=Mycena maculata TaxID=230809 RepID=A0AAD7NR99_9AGAR|nr:hypothetical protein DFH07DRAFT_734229 [Mycena maculata]
MGWLNAQFPNIDPGLILKIVQHEFLPIDLARLDPNRRYDKFVDGCSSTTYPTLGSVVSPLGVYFRVLQTWVAATSRDVEAVKAVSTSAVCYASQLLELNEEFQWPGVLEYHMGFHEQQRQNMTRGDYLQWRVADQELMSHLLVKVPGSREGWAPINPFI